MWPGLQWSLVWRNIVTDPDAGPLSITICSSILCSLDHHDQLWLWPWLSSPVSSISSMCWSLVLGGVRGSCWWPGWHCYTKVAWFRLHQWYSVQCTQLPVHHCTPLYNLEISSLAKVNAQAGIRSVTESVDDEDDEDDLLSIINCDNINTGWSSTSRLMIFDFYSFVEFFSSLKALNHQQIIFNIHYRISAAGDDIVELCCCCSWSWQDSYYNCVETK